MFKTKLVAILTLVTLMFCCITGCNNPKVVTQGENTVAISISSRICEITDDLTLLDYMNALKQKGEIDFIIQDGMIIQINDISQKANSYWMLYTDDGQNSNEAWGTIIFEEKTYASASLGAESLIVKENCTYVWTYQAF